MQATITYLLTEQAQRAQMAATGQPVARKQSISVEVPTEDLALMQVTDDGMPYLNLCPAATRKEDAQVINVTVPQYKALLAAGCEEGRQWYKGASGSHYGLDIPLIPDAQADILALVKSGISKLAAAEQAKVDKTDAAIREFLASDKPVTSEYDRRHVAYTDISDRTDDMATAYVAEASRRFAEFLAAEKEKSAIYARKCAEEKARKDAADAALEQAKTDAIAAFVAASGDALLQQQYAEDLLCRKTVISRMANAALDAAGLPAECPDSVVCQDNDCPCGDSGVDCIPPAVYARWKHMQAPPDPEVNLPNPRLMLPDGSTVEFRKVLNCTRDEDGVMDPEDQPGPTEYHALVTIPSGPFQFTRRIKV